MGGGKRKKGGWVEVLKIVRADAHFPRVVFLPRFTFFLTYQGRGENPPRARALPTIGQRLSHG